MVAVAVVPVKRFDEAMQRLGTAIGADAKPALIQAMATDVLDALERSQALDSTIVVSSEPAIVSLAAERGLEVVADPGGLGHSGAARLGVDRVVDLGADCAALLPGDCPLLDPRELDGALGRCTAGSVAVIPDRLGSGTNGLLIAPPDGIDPGFGPGSRERHSSRAVAAGLEPRIEALPSLGLDLDTPEDLELLREALWADPGRAPNTAAALGMAGGVTEAGADA